MIIQQTSDLETCRQLRRIVFIEEQGVSETEEWDGLDGQALHMLGWIDDRPVATARIFIDGDTAKIGRVCVLRSARGTGVGAAIMRGAVDVLRSRDIRQIRLASQTQVIPFYEKLGFTAYGLEFQDAGIPHRNMVLEL
ncbi:GNAT family N-acetyltransferase [Paracoccus aerodenitrificans]|uniref:GNAT family N-acetyltransferase n=1 Tax=Paracoccus aerodenitrificans TaxID=3017781 RepID=UPI0022F09341|nr:GNAT family N-acetyltransferase [Paracoccus aerodenitrificans]WBU64369.1 GNAT family N-acetyltransferase [Paracoccus aerodenitrificans]